MALLKKFSVAPVLLRRWYWLLSLLLTLIVWGAITLALRPLADSPGRYVSRPYGYMTGLEDSALDLLFQLRNARQDSLKARGLAEPITIIEVDEDSIRESNVRLQAWPRNWYGRLIQHASDAGANTIGLDVYVSESGGVGDYYKQADQQLLDAITNAGNVVIVQKLEAGGSSAITPLPEFGEAASGVGFSDLPHESDRFVRTAQLFRQGADGKAETQLSFASLISQLYTEQPFEGAGEYEIKFGDRKIPLRNDLNLQIDFRGRSPAFTRVSARDILCEDFKAISVPSLQCDPSRRPPDELFRDRIVLIGAANNDAPDLFTTPFYMPRAFPDRPILRLFESDLPTQTKLMPGIEVHANVVATLLNGRYLVRPSWGRQALFVLAPLLIVAAAVFFVRALWGLLITVATGVLVLAASSWAFDAYGVILPLASAELGVLGLLAPSSFLLRYAHERAMREEQEAERAAIMDIFSRCVSPEVADTLWQQRQTLALGGERRIVTVIFTDIRGFTTLSESVSSEVVVTWLNEYFSRMHRIICAYGGHINKYLGDGLMIVFGAPIARGDKLEARAAVSCGLEMLAEVERINQDWEGTGRPQIAIGCGIHTGEALCGVVGAEGRLEYTLIGDTVNLTSRLESTTKEKKVPILISDSTADLLGQDYEIEPMGDVTVKGKTQSTKVYTVRKAEKKKQTPELETVGV
ncbi:MAG TPA: adenylate/guanylate cyclase domain-containing protein [Pyrinomonadaceae bacterium]|nr:adenylate/guanylate cyclase domain-containing protein [Pyrinomonadaceae bacterium]